MTKLENFSTGAQADPVSAAAWIRLTNARGGPGRAGQRALLARFGLPERIFAASPAALREVVLPLQAEALLAPPDAAMRGLVDRTLAWLAASGNHLLTLADAAYPQALLNIPDPPLLLYASGRPALLQRPAVAVVGSRNASKQGLLHAERFSEALSCAGLPVVSGMALGIDSAAHEGGLRGAGATVAVIGTGIDLVYPLRNRALAARIAQEGCIVSEYPIGMPPLACNFPRRNRIISGLSRAVLVVEAALRSGSLITARVAADQGRDVFAIPGSIHSPLAKGCHALIKQGAKLVETVEDMLEELRGCGGGDQKRKRGAAIDLIDAVDVADAFPAPAGSGSASLLDQMGYDPVTLDRLALRSGRGAASLQQDLLMLELEGSVELMPGGAYRRLA